MTLGMKAALGLAAILATILSLSISLLTLNARERLLDEYRSFAVDISNVAEAGLENAMVTRNPDETDSVLQAIHGREHIVDVLVLNAIGQIKYATDPDQVGRVLPMSDPTCTACHENGGRSTTEMTILPDAGSGRILRVATTMRNQPRCQPCHQEPLLGMLVTDLSLAEADADIAAIQNDFVFWALLTGVIAIVAVIGFVQLVIVKPLRHMVAVTHAVGTGDFGQRVGLPGKDEIGALSASFDQMIERVATRTRELEALNAIGVATSETLDLDALLRQALAKVREVTGATWATVHLLNDGEDRLTLAANQRLNDQAASALTSLLEEHGIASDGYGLSQPPEIPNGSQALETVGLDALQPFVAVPLRAGGRAIGVLTVGSSAGRPFAADDVTLLRVVGNQIGAAVDNARLHRQTGLLAITDGLTGLYNRRHFYHQLEQELAGDRLLAIAARLLTGLARKVDTAARYGGEEFVVLMPQTDRAGAIALAQRILAAAPGDWGQDRPAGQQVTFSAGVATFPTEASTPEELVHAADMALYRAKREGKDRVCSRATGTG